MFNILENGGDTMKFGMRMPSLKKSFKAKTTGKIKRGLKSAINPLYGKKGVGFAKNPKRSIYNKVYNKTTFSPYELGSGKPSGNADSAKLVSGDNKDQGYFNDISDIKRVESADAENMNPKECIDLFRAVKKIRMTRTILIWCTIILIFINPIIALLPAGFFVWITLKKGVKLDYNLDKNALEKWDKENAAWHELGSCGKLWYTYLTATTKERFNAGAKHGSQIEVVKIVNKLPWYLKTDLRPFILQIGKKQFAFMPDTILVIERSKIGAVNYSEIDFKFGIQPYAGEIGAPKETEIMRYTWLRVNKDGSPDRRFKDNRQIPIYKLGAIYMTSTSGLNINLLSSLVAPVEKLENLYSTKKISK